MASMVAVGGVILQTSDAGDVYVIRAGTKHEVIRTNSIGEPVFASPAIADGRVYLRGTTHLYAIGG
jgi:outer membrane protein assembly factor BamB